MDFRMHGATMKKRSFTFGEKKDETYGRETD
jgi:hypothetical protein